MINIAFATDNHYAQYIPITLLSILKHNAYHQIQFYVLDMGICDEKKQELTELVHYYHQFIEFIPVSLDDFQSFSINIQYISLATYARLKIADYLPLLDKVLYLDIDILVDGDLAPIWNTALSAQTAVAACRDYFIEYEYQEGQQHKAILGLSEVIYFNAGVLLINLSYWRAYNIFNTALKIWQQYRNLMHYQDQDILNILFKNKVVFLEDRFNVTGATLAYFKAHNQNNTPPQPNSVIYHFTGPQKAWTAGKEDGLYLYLLKEQQGMLNKIRNSQSRRIILTAINHNDQLWFENFVPFALSLRATDYQGEIGVIDYGLSEEHKKVLIKNQIWVFAPANQCDELLLDRHISAAEIAEQYNYDYVAVYDVDIWFPQSTLTLFEQITDPYQLYCTYDAWRCTFLTDCVQPEYVNEINQVLDQLTDKNQYVWQAALIAGHKKAWQDYREYVLQQLDLQRFIIKYGIDSTLLNLYSFATDKIVFLHQKYNCVPVWGVQQTGSVNGFKVFGELVEGLHITRNHRQDPTITYPNLYADNYYQKGKEFQLKPYTMWHITRESMVIYPAEQHHTVLRFDYLHTNGEVIIGLEQDDLYLDVTGESKLSLQNTQEKTVRLFYFYQSKHNKKIPNQIYVRNDKGAVGFIPRIDTTFYIDLAPNSTVEFVTRDLDVEHTGIRWFFKQVRLC